MAYQGQDGGPDNEKGRSKGKSTMKRRRLKSRIDRLHRQEEAIKSLLQPYLLSEVLLAMREYGEDKRPFIMAGMAIWAIKCCRPDKDLLSATIISKERFEKIASQITVYLIDTPVDRGKRQSLISMVLPLFSSQAIYEFGRNDFARSYALWHEIPKAISTNSKIKFNLEDAIVKTHGTSALDFICVAFITFAGSVSNQRFTRSYYEVARRDGVKAPAGDRIDRGLNFLSATQEELKTMAKSSQEKNRSYAPYDRNPLLLRPLVRVWGSLVGQSDERFIAPVPGLIAYRACYGVYHELARVFGRQFTQYFGLVLEKYVESILGNVVGFTLILESDLLSIVGKGERLIDFCLVKSDVIILFEVKAAQFNRSATVLGDDRSVEASVSKIKKAMRQLDDWQQKIEKQMDLPVELSGPKEILKVVVTWETMHFVQTNFVKEGFYGEFADESTVVVSIRELEDMQTIAASGIDLATLIKSVAQNGFPATAEMYQEGLRRTNSLVLSQYDKRLYESIGM